VEQVQAGAIFAKLTGRVFRFEDGLRVKVEKVKRTKKGNRRRLQRVERKARVRPP